MPPTQADPNDVMNEVDGILQSIATLTNKVLRVYDNSDLSNKISGLREYPGVGLIYEGMRSKDSPGNTDHIGLSAEMVFSIVLVMQPEVLFRADTKESVISVLSSIRRSIMGKRSVTGHRYRFLVEAPAEVQKSLAFWVQRWSVPIQLPPGN